MGDEGDMFSDTMCMASNIHVLSTNTSVQSICPFFVLVLLHGGARLEFVVLENVVLYSRITSGRIQKSNTRSEGNQIRVGHMHGKLLAKLSLFFSP